MKLNRADFKIRLFRGTANKLTSAINAQGYEGEPYYATDSRQLYIHNGTSYLHQGIIRTSSASTPTTTEYPNDKDAGLHKNTSTSKVYLAFNDGGTIKKVELI